MMVRVIMFSAIVLAAASVPAAAETGDDGGRLVIGQGIHAGHGHGAMKRKQRPKVCTRNGLRASCQA